jgi:hypothetical protein
MGCADDADERMCAVVQQLQPTSECSPVQRKEEEEGSHIINCTTKNWKGKEERQR